MNISFKKIFFIAIFIVVFYKIFLKLGCISKPLKTSYKYGWPRKALSLISSREHCQWSSPSWISDKLWYSGYHYCTTPFKVWTRDLNSYSTSFLPLIINQYQLIILILFWYFLRLLVTVIFRQKKSEPDQAHKF